MRARVRSQVEKALSGACVLGALFVVKACALTFNDYPAADLCAASSDAGFVPSTAPDPALRGCDAGMPAKTDSNPESAGAAGTDGAP
ncbi:MAG TPA: hypothetical protein VFK05_05325 [Polyangiaceae bacterium]|nr:hypothetical protein [Polyangiaceae bacterium]